MTCSLHKSPFRINPGCYCSTGTAIVTDQNILTSIRHDESVARHDHLLASELDGAEHEVLDDVGEGIFEQKFDDSDAISTVMGDMMERMHLNSKDDGRETSARLNPTRRAIKQCGSCLEDTEMSVDMNSAEIGRAYLPRLGLFLGAGKSQCFVRVGHETRYHRIRFASRTTH